MILKEEPILRTVYTNTKTPKLTPPSESRSNNFMIRRIDFGVFRQWHDSDSWKTYQTGLAYIWKNLSAVALSVMI